VKVMLYLLNFVWQEDKKQSVRLSSGKAQIRNADKGCSTVTYNVAIKHAGEGAAALSGPGWNQAVSGAHKAQVICEGQEEIRRKRARGSA